jgi:hypothetical protein
MSSATKITVAIPSPLGHKPQADVIQPTQASYAAAGSLSALVWRPKAPSLPYWCAGNARVPWPL